MLFDRDKTQHQELPPNLPFIFPKNQLIRQQSNKSLYKNDSQSSHHTINPQSLQLNHNKTIHQSLNVKPSFLSKDLQNSVSIQRYLKRGEEFNKFNAQKILKIENGLQENLIKSYLHKIPKDSSIHHFPVDSQLQEKSNQKSLKKIYLSATNKNKQNSSRLDRLSNKNSKRFSTLSKISQKKQLKQLVNQEVQTQKSQNEKRTIKNKNAKTSDKLLSKGTPKINTLEVLERSNLQNKVNEKSHLNVSKFINLSSILQKDQEEHQPPKKMSSFRHNNLQTKYLINQSFTGQLSTAPSTYTNTYLDSMSKLSQNFNKDIEIIRKNRYEFSQSTQKMSPERYNHTMGVTTNVQRNLDVQINSSGNREVQKQIKDPSSIERQSRLAQSCQGRRKENQEILVLAEQQFHGKQNLEIKQNQSLKQQNKGMSLSIVPQQSQTMNSINSQSVFQPFSVLSIVNEQGQDHANSYIQRYKHQNTSQKHHKQRTKTNKNKINLKQKQKQIKHVDQMMQFPEVSELKISPVQNYQSINQNKIIHPIRNNFNEKGINWITDTYNPKSKIFDSINFNNFIIKKYKNGVFFGELQDGRKQGSGIIFYFNGKLYEGKFSNDLKNGQGYEQFPDGSKYQGQFKDGTKCGKGVFQWSNGQVYQGQWFNGKKHGSGIWKSADGQSYIGEWNYGIAQGFGVYISKIGDRYEGEFQNSQKQGFGTERYHNGQTYVGEYRKNRPNGQGQYFWTNGNYYKGQFVNHLRHGQGYFKNTKTGQQYKGQYRNDKKCGFGQLIQNQKTYVGNFQNDYKHGYGQLYEDQVCKFKGYWINGKTLEDEQGHQENCPLISQKIQAISQKPQLRNQNSQSKINRIRTINRSKIDQGKSSLGNSKSPKNKSIESRQNSLQKSNYKRSCGCARKH